MAEFHLRQDALAHRALLQRRSNAAAAGVRLCLQGPRTQIALRGNAADPAFEAAVARVTGAPLPRALSASHGSGADILWMGPDEWLLVASEDEGLWQHLDEALAGQHALASDVSSSRVILALGGAHAVQVLAKGCGLDFHPRRFPADHVAQSTLARAHAMLHRLGDDSGFHIYVHRSFADYVFSWLEDAAAEYGLAIA